MIAEIITGDCVESMAAMDDKSVDLAFADPPYNVGKDYEVYDDNLPDSEYIAWMESIIASMKRISRRGIVVYVGGKLTKLFYDLIPDAHLITVHKRAIGPMTGNYFLQYHSMFPTASPLKPTKDLWDDIRLPGEGYFFPEQRYDHPGLTGFVLMKRIIDTFTEKGDVVFDPFFGTGTTGAACSELGRGFIGVELNPRYCDIARDRIAVTNSQLTLGL